MKKFILTHPDTGKKYTVLEAAKKLGVQKLFIYEKIHRFGINDSRIWNEAVKNSIVLVYPKTGKKYTVRNAAEKIGIGSGAMHGRIRRHGKNNPRIWLPKQDYFDPKSSAQIFLTHPDNGKDYSVLDASKIIGIDVSSMKERVATYGIHDSRVWSVKNARMSTKSKKRILVHPETRIAYTMQEAAERIGIHTTTLLYRIKCCGEDTLAIWKKKGAFNNRKIKMLTHPETGDQYSYAAAAQFLNISSRTLQNRIKRYGCSSEIWESIQEKYVRLCGEIRYVHPETGEYLTVREVGQEYGFAESTMRQRIREGKLSWKKILPDRYNPAWDNAESTEENK